MRENNIEIDENLIFKIEDIEHSSDEISKLFDSQTFDAVVAVNEMFAVVALKEAHKRKIIVPSDLSVIAFTDGIISKYATPTLTTVSQNGVAMGRKSAEMLIEKLEMEETETEQYRTEVIPSHLVLRESTKS